MDVMDSMLSTIPDQLHVMMVDDEDDYHLITRLMMKKAGFTGKLSAFLGAEEALAHLETDRPPDILLLDINMPNTDGFEFLAYCKERDLIDEAHTTVIMCSSSNRPLDIQRAEEVRSIRGYIEKPLTSEQFEQIVNEHISRARA